MITITNSRTKTDYQNGLDLWWWLTMVSLGKQTGTTH